MKYLRKKYVAEVAYSELDLENLEVIFGATDDYHEHEVIESSCNNKMYWAGEAEPIKIDLLIKTLQELKDAGCNYVEVANHSDHYGYNIYGLEMREATKEEVKQHDADEKKRIKAHIEQKIKALKEDISNLKKQL